MKHLRILLAVLFLSLFALSSCVEETESNLNENEETEALFEVKHGNKGGKRPGGGGSGNS